MDRLGWTGLAVGGGWKKLWVFLGRCFVFCALDRASVSQEISCRAAEVAGVSAVVAADTAEMGGSDRKDVTSMSVELAASSAEVAGVSAEIAAGSAEVAAKPGMHGSRWPGARSERSSPGGAGAALAWSCGAAYRSWGMKKPPSPGGFFVFLSIFRIPNREN